MKTEVVRVVGKNSLKETNPCSLLFFEVTAMENRILRKSPKMEQVPFMLAE